MNKYWTACRYLLSCIVSAVSTTKTISYIYINFNSKPNLIKEYIHRCPAFTHRAYITQYDLSRGSMLK